ncbi:MULTISPECIES: uracil-DNA glycosylase [unclassified Curtobacterium]|uniref:uracil-DNA glycosylase n=1 Tax=unclassified Curtobacterium TaxID=257496 RepID=UPI0039B101B8
MFLDTPRGFRDPARILERGDMLRTAKDTLPLEAWARDVEDRRRRQQPEIVLPHFDPAETGIRSQVLLLLEAPGPKTVPEWGGSGFISVDNNDPTAQNVWRTRDEVGLHRGVLAWNIVPWVLGRASVKPTPVDLAQGAVELRGLLALLPDLRCVILSGQKAQAGWDEHLDLTLGDRYRVLRTVHPAGQSFAQAGAKEHFVATLTKAATFIDRPAGG